MNCYQHQDRAAVGVTFLAYGGLTSNQNWERTCRHCGYSLTGNRSGRCPECGENIKTGE